MTVREAIDSADKLRPNAADDRKKREWLLQAESRIYKELYITHEHNGIAFTDTEKIITDDATELFANTPFDEMYVLYLCLKIDYAHAEYERYRNDSALFDTLYDSFCRFWNREHISAVRTRITG